MPTGWGEWSALVSILAAVLGLLAWVFHYFHRDITNRIDASARQLSEIKEWQTHMEEIYLPQTYARKDLMDLQLREAKESNGRVEVLVKEIKADLRESMHALRTDLITLVKKDFQK